MILNMSNEKKAYTKLQFKKEFAKLLEKTIMTNNLPTEESLKVITNLHDFVLPYIPSKLFRFRKCELDEFISFEQGNIPMCIAGKFPDKFDSTVYYNHEILMNKFENAYDLVMPNVIKALRINPLAVPDSPIRSKILEMINLKLEDCTILQEIRNFYSSIIINMKKEIGKSEEDPRNNKMTTIACFTENVKSKFMWDTYAKGYEGFALEYDFRKWYVIPNANLYPVIYGAQKIDATDIIDKICIYDIFENNQQDEPYKDTYDAIKKLFYQENPIDLLYFIKRYLYKNKTEYAHEKEWRLLNFDPTNTEEFTVVPDMGCLKAIYYGPFMKSRYKVHMHHIAKQKGIKEYDVILDTNSRKYALKTVPLKT